MERIIKRVFLTCYGLAVGFVLAVCVWPGRFGYRSVCSLCGLEVRNTEIHFGLFETGIGKTWAYETNSVAAVLMESPSVSGHQHAWVFAAGGGAGVKCAIGDGRHLWQAVRSTNVAAFLGELARSDVTPSVLRWRDRFLNPKQSRDAMFAVMSAENERGEGEPLVRAAEEEFLRSQSADH